MKRLRCGSSNRKSQNNQRYQSAPAFPGSSNIVLWFDVHRKYQMAPAARFFDCFALYHHADMRPRVALCSSRSPPRPSVARGSCMVSRHGPLDPRSGGRDRRRVQTTGILEIIKQCYPQRRLQARLRLEFAPDETISVCAQSLHLDTFYITPCYTSFI